MLELALKGNKTYWSWIIVLLGLIGIGTVTFVHQCNFGLGVTGLSRDVSWGLYIAQLTFLVGVAASAVMAPRFLASAFSSGPAFLILLCLIIRKLSNFDPGSAAIQSLSKIAAYALIANLFFLGCEVFVVFYGGIPEHMAHFRYLYLGLEGHSGLVPWMWTALGLMFGTLILLITPSTRRDEAVLMVACIGLFIGTWIDKGLGLISGGFVPTPLHEVVDYVPTLPELAVSIGIYGIGLLVLTTFIKIVVTVKAEINAND